MGKQVFEWVRRNPRQGFAAFLFVVGGLLGWWVADYVIGQVGSEPPELALSYEVLRFGTFVLFGLLAARAAMGNIRQGIAVALGVAGSLLGWRMMDYVVGQIGSESPELAVPYLIIRIGVVLLFALLAASLVLGKASAR